MVNEVSKILKKKIKKRFDYFFLEEYEYFSIIIFSLYPKKEISSIEYLIYYPENGRLYKFFKLFPFPQMNYYLLFFHWTMAILFEYFSLV